MSTVIRTTEDQGSWVGGTPGHFTERDAKGRRTWVPGDSPKWESKPVVVSERVLTPVKCRQSKRAKKARFTSDPQSFTGTYRSGFATR
jgi:hypothetical protein